MKKRGRSQTNVDKTSYKVGGTRNVNFMYNFIYKSKEIYYLVTNVNRGRVSRWSNLVNVVCECPLIELIIKPGTSFISMPTIASFHFFWLLFFITFLQTYCACWVLNSLFSSSERWYGVRCKLINLIQPFSPEIFVCEL